MDLELAHVGATTSTGALERVLMGGCPRSSGWASSQVVYLNGEVVQEVGVDGCVPHLLSRQALPALVTGSSLRQLLYPFGWPTSSARQHGATPGATKPTSDPVMDLGRATSKATQPLTSLPFNPALLCRVRKGKGGRIGAQTLGAVHHTPTCCRYTAPPPLLLERQNSPVSRRTFNSALLC